MRKTLSVLCCCLFTLLLAAVPAMAKGKQKNGKRGQGNQGGVKVCLCHIPPGNPSAAHTICVGSPAVRAHLAHGDTEGECSTTCGGENGASCGEGQFCERPAGECSEEAEGSCVETPDACPVLEAPVCGCDGVTYHNECFAAAAGVTVASQGECAASEACGGTAGDTCTESQFCQHDEGVCDVDAVGVCTEKPGACQTVLAPVCGCDGVTYDNACFAAGAGVTVASDGECAPTQACGGAAGDTCTETQFCKREEGVCSEEAEGVCTEKPGPCQSILNPVCGCDGITYDNACQAGSAGVTIASQGECVASVACGGTAGTTCEDGSFCKHEDGECAENAEGVCTVIPQACPSIINLVCGCDNRTYANECMANGQGVTVASEGECAP